MGSNFQLRPLIIHSIVEECLGLQGARADPCLLKRHLAQPKFMHEMFFVHRSRHFLQARRANPVHDWVHVANIAREGRTS